jgi:hypothetical protein
LVDRLGKGFVALRGKDLAKKIWRYNSIPKKRKISQSLGARGFQKFEGVARGELEFENEGRGFVFLIDFVIVEREKKE